MIDEAKLAVMEARGRHGPPQVHPPCDLEESLQRDVLALVAEVRRLRAMADDPRAVEAACDALLEEPLRPWIHRPWTEGQKTRAAAALRAAVEAVLKEPTR